MLLSISAFVLPHVNLADIQELYMCTASPCLEEQDELGVWLNTQVPQRYIQEEGTGPSEHKWQTCIIQFEDSAFSPIPSADLDMDEGEGLCVVITSQNAQNGI